MNTIKDLNKLFGELMRTRFTFKVNGVEHTLSASEIGYTYKYDRAVRRFGCCNYRYKTISLSKPLCINNLDKIHTKIKDTILHEIAHAFSVHIHGWEGKGHGSKWRSIAIAIGCNGKRCYDGSKVNNPQSKYTLVCDSCTTEIPRHRKPKRQPSCGKCDSTYNPKYILRLKQNY